MLLVIIHTTSEERNQRRQRMLEEYGIAHPSRQEVEYADCAGGRAYEGRRCDAHRGECEPAGPLRRPEAGGRGPERRRQYLVLLDDIGMPSIIVALPWMLCNADLWWGG